MIVVLVEKNQNNRFLNFLFYIQKGSFQLKF